MDRARKSVWSKVALPMVAMLTASGCLTPGADTIAQTTSPATSSPDETGGDLYVKVSLAWENTSEYEEFETCRIPVGSASSTLNCSMKIPEARLFYSKVRFTVGTSNPGSCRLLIFRPYYYLASTAASFDPHWNPQVTGVACNDVGVRGGPADPECYNGPAKEIVTDFPIYTGMYFVVNDDENSTDYDAEASNTLQYNTNRYIASGNPTPAVPDPGRYVDNTLVNYSVVCQDQFAEEQKTISLTITDQDLETGEDPADTDNDDFEDWGEM